MCIRRLDVPTKLHSLLDNFFSNTPKPKRQLLLQQRTFEESAAACHGMLNSCQNLNIQ